MTPCITLTNTVCHFLSTSLPHWTSLSPCTALWPPFRREVGMSTDPFVHNCINYNQTSPGNFINRQMSTSTQLISGKLCPHLPNTRNATTTNTVNTSPITDENRAGLCFDRTEPWKSSLSKRVFTALDQAGLLLQSSYAQNAGNGISFRSQSIRLLPQRWRNFIYAKNIVGHAILCMPSQEPLRCRSSKSSTTCIIILFQSRCQEAAHTICM